MLSNQSLPIRLTRRRSRYERTQAGTVGLIVRAKINHHVPVAKVPGLGWRLTGSQISQIDTSSAPNIVKEALMDEIAMVPVHAIFDLEFPVRPIPIFVDPGCHIQFALRGEVSEQVELFLDSWA